MLEQVEALSKQVAQQQVTIQNQQTRLSELANRPTTIETKRSTSRRQLLRHLAVGLVSGLALGGATMADGSQSAQASTVINPPSTNNQVGAIVVPPGKPQPVGAPPITPPYYGLVATDGTNVALSSLDTFSTALSGITATSGGNGVYGKAIVDGSLAIYGVALGNNSYGVYSIANTTGSYAGFFQGNMQVNGTLNKSGGSFKIDHPLDPANAYLYHSFVESPDMKNIYDGVVTLDGQGTTTVTLPTWFETLNSDFRYSLTAIGEPSPDLYIAQEVAGSQFKIAGGKAGQRVSWQLTGIRQDEWAKAHRIPVEEVKPDHERGLYLHPELYGQGLDKAIGKRPDRKR